ncbi:Leucine-rich repeat domain superfamily [Sesbania bispinosa]|nr:Leucine-rich repeat domain superfamily [Sesbania bispinosa]
MLVSELSCLGLDGTLGYLLSDLMSLKKLDLRDNKIRETIPYQLPPKLTSLPSSATVLAPSPATAQILISSGTA